MNLLFGTATKTFNLLSIGQRGVGKTVFLAGSYAELHSDSQTSHPQHLWFDCQDSQVQKNIEDLFSFVARTGQYPPSTLKIMDFNFSLKRRRLWGAQTLCHFRWYDIPGESCRSDNCDFRTIVSTSHGCCVFIDAYALVHNNAYLKTLEDLIEQVTAIASLVHLNRLKYPFALILTKCDLLESISLSQQQLSVCLEPFTTRLDAVIANYQTFYSSIPIVHTEGASTLRAKGAAAPFLWLVCELSKANNPGLMNHLLELVTFRLPSGFQLRQFPVDGLMHSLNRPDGKAFGVKKSLGLYLLPTTRRNVLILTTAIVGLIGFIGLFLVNYEPRLQSEPKNPDALRNLATHSRSGQLNQAVSWMEKVVQQNPESLERRLQLAQLYEITGQLTKAETAYDQVLAKQKNNLIALLGKAQLRKVQGDTKTAEALFVQAEKAAPTEFKAQVRALAQKTLKEPTQQVPPAK